MSNIKKFGYATNELFTLTGSNYVGYYNIKNNDAYVGKYTQQIPLGNYNNIQNTLTRSDLFFNRLPTEDFSLTYSLSDFTFQPNEFINGNSFDNKLKKAFINFLDTYRACFMASSNLPYNLTAVGRVSATYNTSEFVLVGPIENNTSSISALSVLNPLISKNSKIAYVKGETTPYNTLIIANSATLMVYKLQNYSTFALTFSSSYVQTGGSEYGTLNFNNISSLTNYGNNLYICDSGNSAVYAYDITGVLENDRALGSKFNLSNSVNSTQGDFITPTLVAASSDTIFVYDSKSFTVFYYDTNFNLYNYYKNQALFTQSTPVSLTFYQIYNQLFVLTDDFKLIILNPEAEPIIIQLSTRETVDGEVAKKIIFSNSNSDVLYLLTNKNLYKKFVSNIVNSIGDYSFTQGVTGIRYMPTGSDLYDISITQTNNDYDDIMLFGYQQFLNYNEKTEFNSIIK